MGYKSYIIFNNGKISSPYLYTKKFLSKAYIDKEHYYN